MYLHIHNMSTWTYIDWNIVYNLLYFIDILVLYRETSKF